MRNCASSVAEAFALKRAFHVSDMVPPARLRCLHGRWSGGREDSLSHASWRGGLLLRPVRKNQVAHLFHASLYAPAFFGLKKVAIPVSNFHLVVACQ
jgi:hypothetical protein